MIYALYVHAFAYGQFRRRSVFDDVLKNDIVSSAMIFMSSIACVILCSASDHRYGRSKMGKVSCLTPFRRMKPTVTRLATLYGIELHDGISRL